MTVSFTSIGKSLAVGRFAKAIGVADGDPFGALAFAEGQKTLWQSTPETYMALKSAVDAMATGDPGGLADVATGALILPLVRNLTLVDRLPSRRVPLNTGVAAFSTDANAHLVGEGLAKPLSKFSTTTVRVEPRKIAASVVVTRDLLRMAGADAEVSIANELVRAATAGMDYAFATPEVVGSISNNATTFSSSGLGVTQLDADFRLMLDALAATGDQALQTATWVMSSKMAVYLSGLRTSGGSLAYPTVTSRGGTLMGLPALTTGAMVATGSPTESSILLIDPNQVLYGDESVARVSVAKSASVQLSDTPTSTAVQQISLFQSNYVEMRCERWCGWNRVAASSVIVLDNVQIA